MCYIYIYVLCVYIYIYIDITWQGYASVHAGSGTRRPAHPASNRSVAKKNGGGSGAVQRSGGCS